jgi:hypothetical protein
MVEENQDVSPEEVAKREAMLAKMAKARATRAANKAAASATERVIAPDTVTEPAVLATEPVQPEVQVVEKIVEVEKIVYVPTPAPAPQAVAPRQMQVERQGAKSEPYTRRFPQVRGGVCEFCGVLDPNVPSQFQYKLCGHYRGMQLRCSYCPENKDPDEINYHSNLNIASHPDNPNTLIVWCDSFNCSDAHLKRFQRVKA